MWNKLVRFYKANYIFLFSFALIAATTKLWIPAIDRVNPITTPHEAWTDLHFSVALLIGLTFSNTIASFLFVLFKIFKKVEQDVKAKAANTEGNVASSPYPLHLFGAASGIGAALIGLGGVAFFIYQVFNHPVFQTNTQIFWVLILGIILGLTTVFVLAFWLPKKFMPTVYQSTVSSKKMLSLSILSLEDEWRELKNQLQMTKQTESELRMQYEALNLNLNALNEKLMGETEEAKQEQLNRKIKDHTERVNELRDKIEELVNVKFEIQEKSHSIGSQIAFAKNQKNTLDNQEDIDELTNRLDDILHGKVHVSESSNQDIHAANIRKFAEVKKVIDEVIQNKEELLKKYSQSDNGDKKVKDLQAMLAKLQKTFSTGINFHKFIQDQYQQSKASSKEFLGLKEQLQKAQDDKEAAKAKEKSKYYLEMAVQYKEMSDELTNLLEVIKDNTITVQHKLTLANADQNIRNLKKPNPKH